MDEIEAKTDAEKALGETKAAIEKLGDEAHAGETWVRAHTAWLIGGGSFLAGIVVGHFLR
jgi:hypothetical protein